MVGIKYAALPYIQTIYPDIPGLSNFQFVLYGIVMFLFIFGVFYESKSNDSISRKSIFWRMAQTFTTALLFSTWLMHDMVNIAVFLPRGLENMGSIGLYIMLTISGLFALALAYTFYING